MNLVWVRDETPVWDEGKRRVIGGAPEGAFLLSFADGDPLPGEWWEVRDGEGPAIGYGRLDISWGGDAEILLAVDPVQQEHGLGSYILGNLENEAVKRGINYIYNTIREHERRDFVHDWLVVRGFRGHVDGDLRKRVGARAPVAAATTAPHGAPYDVNADPSGRAPGQEEQGGYVDVDEHQY